MKSHVVFLQILLTLIILSLSGCDRSSAMSGQSNTTLVFYGVVVDQDGKPLSDARIVYQVEAYPKDWTFETRGRPYDISSVAATSDQQGRFSFSVTGCFLRLTNATRTGYRHLWEQDTADGYQHASTYAYQLISWSTLCYKSDPGHPAVFVFVKDGVREVSALPCKGGYDSANGNSTQWRLNRPGWPNEPSLDDVVQKQPITGAQ